MGLSTNLVSGLASGFDWRTMIDQLIEIERRRVNLVEDTKTEYEAKLSEWQSVNSMLLSLKTAAQGLKDPADFYLYATTITSNSGTVEASELLSVSTTTSASPGTYNIGITDLAKAQKLSSKAFSTYDTALELSGEFVINGQAVSVEANDDLTDIRDKINNLNTGTTPTEVTATILSVGSSDYRLILTSDVTGKAGIDLKDASAETSNILQGLGFTYSSSGTTKTIKSVIGTSTLRSDYFASRTSAVGTLLGLTSAQSSDSLTIGDKSDISINLATDSLDDIKDAIDAGGGPTGVIYGAGVQVNDTITISGTDHNGNAVSGSLKITDTGNTVQELLTAIQDTFGNVTASIIDGKIRVTDNTAGDSQLSVTLTENNQGGGALDFGSIITTTVNVGNKRNTTIYGAGVQVNDTITISGTDHNGNAVSGSLKITDTGNTVQELLTAIETAYSNTVTASITSEGKIMVVDDSSGTSYLSVTLTENNEGGGSLDFGVIEVAHGGSDREMVAGSDATLSVDGLQVTSTDNTVEDVIAGVTLNLLKADSGTTITLNVERDIDAIMENIQSFVDSYNDIASYIHQQQSYDEEEEKTGGVLFGDSTLSSVKSDLTSTLLQTVWGVSSDFSILGLVGINLDKEGQLSIDTDTLRGYLETNFNDIKLLFAANGTTDTGTLKYIGYSRDTQPNEYTVYITNAAVRSNSTSDNGTVGEDETLTITEEGKTARISLTTSMSLAQTVSAINSELDTVYTENLVGGNALQEGGSAITSSTKWENIDGTSWDGVEKVISFSGTTRSGKSIQGSYEDFDVSTDTVQGLLTEIEEAFSNEVTASIDSSGRIVLTDKYAGNSQLSLEITEPAGSNLDFGDVDVTPGEGDGSQEGRYAIPVTASDDGDGHLVLTHDRYGSGYSFTISEDAALVANKLWTGGDQTVENGEDVAGTIGSKEATGSGQVLTGTAGDVEGLVIKYTGTDEGQNVGEIKLTIGVAELFDRALFNITDPIDGYVVFKQNSLQDRVGDLEDQIEEMEERLDRKMEMMINRFVAMEVALSRTQSQSDWLSGQVSASFRGWAWL